MYFDLSADRRTIPLIPTQGMRFQFRINGGLPVYQRPSISGTGSLIQRIISPSLRFQLFVFVDFSLSPVAAFIVKVEDEIVHQQSCPEKAKGSTQQHFFIFPIIKITIFVMENKDAYQKCNNQKNGDIDAKHPSRQHFLP